MKINNLNFDFFKILIKKVKKLIPIFIKDESKIYMILFFIKLKKFKSFINKTYPNPQNDLNRIIENFEFWINEKKQKYKIKGFIEDTFIPSTKDTSSFYAIQQVKKEIYEFVKVIFDKSLNESILEIGLGYYGGSHILWRLIFKKVITIEININTIKRFLKNETLSTRDIFIIGNSQDPKTLKKTKKLVKQVDVLFIDGDHTYENVKNDYLLYKNLVKKGGIIAFHDSACTLEEIGFGVNKFLTELQKGLIDGKNHILNHIIFSKAVGISWIIK